MPSDNELIGRERELEAIDRLLSSPDAWPAGLVIRGPAGIGKTSLWHAAVATARDRGLMVLEARVIERELEESFGCLGDLLVPLTDGLSLLPPPQRHALEAALLLADPGPKPPGHRPMGLGLLGLMRAQAGPVLIAIDDVQWIDAASGAVLSFVLRRLSDVPVGLLVTERQTDGIPPDQLGLGQLADWSCAAITVSPLSLGAVHSLVRNILGIRLSRPAIRRVHELSQGNPFYVRELAHVLAAAPLTRDPWQIPLPADLSAALSRRLADIPTVDREVLAAAALTVSPTRTTLRAVAGQGAEDGLRAGMRAGVVQLDGDVVRFAHPLLATVLLQELGPEEKRLLHRRLASVVVDESERAQHLGLAAHRPSARVAGVLESASRREMDRGAPTAAAELLRLAADLVPGRDRERRHTDLLEAARLHAMGGAMMLAQDLAGSVLSDRPTGAVASEARLLLAELTPNVEGHLRATEAVLAEKRADPAIRSRAAALASQTRFITGDLRGALDLARAALRWATASRNPRLIVIASCSLAILETWAGHETPGLLESTFEIAATNHSYLTYQNNPLVVRGLRHLYRDELTEARHALEAALEEAREHGDVDGVAGVLFHLAELECRAANFGAAVARANEFVLLSEQLGYDQSLGAALYAFALAQAHIGNVDVAREAVGNGLRIAGEVGDWVMSIQHHGVLGFLELSLGNFEAAAHELRALPAALLAHGIREPSVFPVWPNAIESLLWIGDLSEADALLATYVSLADELDCPWARATAARCEGLLAAARGDLVSAEEALARALIAHERVPSAFERARTQLALGSVLRRAKRRREARAILAQAEATLRDLGADRWAERVAAEATRIGGRRPGGPGLSVTEEQVARLVATGHTNREVAAALFVTERTVEANLSSIYAKLGIRSRTELTRAILTGDRRPAP